MTRTGRNHVKSARANHVILFYTGCYALTSAQDHLQDTLEGHPRPTSNPSSMQVSTLSHSACCRACIGIGNSTTHMALAVVSARRRTNGT